MMGPVGDSIAVNVSRVGGGIAVASNTQTQLGGGLHLGDLTGDGRDEFIVVSGDTIEVFRDGMARELLAQASVRADIRDVLVGRFRKLEGVDRDQLIVWQATGDVSLLSLTERGELRWSHSQTSFLTKHHRAVVGDFDGNGLDEVLIIDNKSNEVDLIQMIDGRTFGRHPAFTPGNLSSEKSFVNKLVLAGEFNGDTTETDLVVFDVLKGQLSRYAGVSTATGVTFHWAFTTAEGALPRTASVAVGNLENGETDGLAFWDPTTRSHSLYAVDWDNRKLRMIDSVNTVQMPSPDGGKSWQFGSVRDDRWRNEPGRRRNDLVVADRRTGQITQADARFDARNGEFTYWWAYDSASLSDLEQLRTLGYQQMVATSRNRSGGLHMWNRPALLVLVDVDGQDPIFHPPSYYQTFFFNRRSNRSAANALDQLGAGLAALRSDPVRIRLTADENVNNLSRRATTIIDKVIDEIGADQLAMATRLMGDGDNVVETDEIALIVIDTGSADSGANRSAKHVQDRNLRIDARISFMGHRVGLMTAVHELLHDFGAKDIYGADQGRNLWLSTMASSSFGTNDDRRMVLPDPWHRSQLGLTRPRLIDVRSYPSGSIVLPAPSLDIANSALLFWDPRKGPRHQYFVEYRTNAMVQGSVTLDNNVPEGFLIWQVGLDRDMEPYQVNSLTTSAGTDSSINHIAKDGVRGGQATFSNGDNVGPLIWIDGTNSGLHLSFKQVDRLHGEISWSLS